MNNEKLILESLSWIMRNINSRNLLELEEWEELNGRISDAVNPEEEKTISEETHDGLSEQNVPTHKEFQKAIDKAGLRGYKFKDSEVKG